MYCENCGKKLEEGARYCVYCGYEVPSESMNDTENVNAENSDINFYESGDDQGPKKKFPVAVIVIIAIIAVAVIAIGVWAATRSNGSKDKERDVTATETEATSDAAAGLTDAQTAETASSGESGAIDLTTLVTDAYSDVFDYTDSVSNSGTYSYYIPQINLDSEDISEINDEIWEDLYEDCLEEVYECVDGGYSLNIIDMCYDWAVNGDILSLLITVQWDYDYTLYYVYNVSISDEAELSDSKLISACGLTQSDYEEMVRQALYSYNYENFEQYVNNSEGSNKSSAVSFSNEQLSKTISDDNVEDAEPFLNEDGQLCIIGNVYTIAGAGYYARLINLEDFEVNANYPDLFEEVATSDSEYILPDSDSRYLTASDVAGLSDTELMLARNEIYARHGRKFNDDSIQAYFNSKSWYHGTIDPEDFSASLLNQYELANIELIKSYED